MFDASTLEVFIASTNDLAPARKAVEEVLRDWNSRNGKERQIMLRPIRWEADVTPELGPGSFQAVINNRLLDHADILVGIVGKRLGSPTGGHCRYRRRDRKVCRGQEAGSALLL